MKQQLIMLNIKNPAIDINLTTLLINNVVSKYQTNLQVNYTTIINNI